MVIKTVLSIFIGGVIGGGVGYMLRCSGGQCPLTCNPWGGAIFGAIIGLSFVLQ